MSGPGRCSRAIPGTGQYRESRASVNLSSSLLLPPHNPSGAGTHPTRWTARVLLGPDLSGPVTFGEAGAGLSVPRGHEAQRAAGAGAHEAQRAAGDAGGTGGASSANLGAPTCSRSTAFGRRERARSACVVPKPPSCAPEPRIPNPGTRNPKPEPWNPEPETRILEPETRYPRIPRGGALVVPSDARFVPREGDHRGGLACGIGQSVSPAVQPLAPKPASPLQ